MVEETKTVIGEVVSYSHGKTKTIMLVSDGPDLHLVEVFGRSSPAEGYTSIPVSQCLTIPLSMYPVLIKALPRKLEIKKRKGEGDV